MIALMTTPATVGRRARKHASLCPLAPSGADLGVASARHEPILCAGLQAGGAQTAQSGEARHGDGPGRDARRPAPAKNPQLLPALKGLRLVPDIKALVRKGVSEPGISVGTGLPLLEDAAIQTKLAGFLGKPLHAHDLSLISQTILDWYRAHDLPVVDVAFPEQDINSGTVQGVVTVYRLGQVEVSGNRWFSSDVLKDEMQVRPGDKLDFATLKEDLNRLNRNPFRSVNAILERSKIPGETNVALHVQDRLPLRVFASLDNDGLPSTGRDRYSAGFNWGNVFGLDQQFSYQFITSPDLWRTRHRAAGHSNDPRFTAHSASYLVPLPWGDVLNVFGTYVEQVPDLGPNFDQVGHSVQLSLRYERPLPAIGALSQQIQIGFDYKRTDNNLDFGGTNIFASATNVEQFLAIYDATLPDSLGQTAVQNQLVVSPGGLSNGNTSAVYIASGVNGARANYVYDNLADHAGDRSALAHDLGGAAGRAAGQRRTPAQRAIGRGRLGQRARLQHAHGQWQPGRSLEPGTAQPQLQPAPASGRAGRGQWPASGLLRCRLRLQPPCPAGPAPPCHAAERWHRRALQHRPLSRSALRLWLAARQSPRRNINR